ncbi:hypothetical protein Thi970DRAFT_02470 [Thiorhodovibrio frisius]|uniref:Uncharacterized protein n=1 Tax=Thiorhodovibrio frisius TaxID=631362 RepID=H8YZU1_9GAMM|nr:hypothetical protein Thi970DRAFT_02470 [Thiorhodovibrio frisius]WPL24512.1 hypothetical protein Thiofri_04732 [Thiorhodovibrio frisius]
MSRDQGPAGVLVEVPLQQTCAIDRIGHENLRGESGLDYRCSERVFCFGPGSGHGIPAVRMPLWSLSAALNEEALLSGLAAGTSSEGERMQRNADAVSVSGYDNRGGVWPVSLPFQQEALPKKPVPQQKALCPKYNLRQKLAATQAPAHLAAPHPGESADARCNRTGKSHPCRHFRR